MVLALVKSGRLRKIYRLAVDACAKALLIQLIEQVLKLTFAAAHDGGHDGDSLAGAEFENALNDLVGGLPGNRAAAIRAVWCAHRGVEKAQIVVDLGDGAHGGARTAAGRLLLNRDGRAETFDGIHVGPLNLVEELPCVG